MPVSVKVPGSAIALAEKRGGGEAQFDFLGQIQDERRNVVGNVRAAGIQVPSDTIHNTSPVTVTIGTANAQVFGSAIQVPTPMPDGDYPIKATVSGVSSPDGVILSVKN